MFRGFQFIFFVFFSFPLIAEAQVPVANFTSDVTSGCTPVVVSFTDISTNNPTSWRWDLGNGVISTNRDPQTSYFTAGFYTITLTATNASGSNTVTKTSYLQVYALPNVDFVTADTVGCVPLKARFTDLSNANSGTLKTWEWNFGDGGTSNLQNPTYTYKTTGAYSVNLKVLNSFGCTKNTVKALYVRVGNSIKADFIVDLAAFCNPPAKVDFLNTSTSSGSMTYSWKFGDGNVSSAKDPSHAYAAYGRFPVTLFAASDGGCTDSIIKAINITQRLIDFTGPDSLCAGFAGAFTAFGQPQPTAIQWQMGDGTTYSGASISHTYTSAGTFTISLISQVNNCSDTVRKTIRINPSPLVNFTANATSSCKVPFTVTFQNTTAGATSWLWNFGDGTTSTQQNPSKIYTAFGNYAISLTATSNRGCIQSITKTDFIKIQPSNVTISNLPATGCLPFTYSPSIVLNSATNITSYKWDFGDGFRSTLATPTHTYNLSGSYTIKLNYSTAAGCSDSLIINSGVMVGANVPVDFTANPQIACGKQNIFFTSLVTSPVKSYAWTFGDGTTSIIDTPGHRYVDTGYYSVTLTADSNGCKSTATKKNFIYVGGTIARFSFVKDCVKRGQVNFKNESISGTTYYWNFGDGNTSNLVNPAHIYLRDGDYKVLLVSENNGCRDSLVINVPVWLRGIDVTVAKDTICKGETAYLTLIHPRPEYISLINWDYGNGSNTEAPTSPINQYYNTVGDFNLTAVSTDIYGCRDTVVKPKFIRVNGPAAKFDAAITKGCRNTEITFADSSTTDGLNSIVKWEWNFGDGTSQIFRQPPFKHIYATGGNFDVTLKVTDASGCNNSITRNKFVLISEARADFLSLDSLTCGGSQVSFRDFSTGSIISHRWDFGDGAISTLADPKHAYVDTGMYTVKLYVTSSSGCIDSVSKPNYITVKNPVAKFGTSNLAISCAPLQVNFYDSSYYAKSWLWEFSDGKTSNFQNPSNAFFKPGIEVVKLTVTSNGGCQSVYTSNLQVTGPVGNLSYTPLAGCENGSTIRYSASVVGASEFKWDFNDGTIITGSDSTITHVYKARGKFLPKVIFTDASGCTLPIEGKDTVTIEGATAKFISETKVICENGVIVFKDSSVSNSSLTYRWDFGDGTTSLAKNPLPHRYASAGNYSVKLVVTTQNNCRDSSIFSNYIKVVKYPVVTISSDTIACENFDITFTSQVVADTSAITSWLWKFGNGQTSSLQNPPAQRFSMAGTFSNSLTVVNSNGCSVEKFNSVTIQPIPKITTSDTTICLGDSIRLVATGSGSFSWTPSINLSCTNCNSPFASPVNDQTYIVNATSTLRCANEDSVTIKILKPFAVTTSFVADSICIGETVQLQASGADKYLWTPTAGLNFNNISNPKVTPPASRLYSVVGYDSLGCFRDTASSQIVVYTYPTVELGPDIVLSAGNSQMLSPVYTGVISKYAWLPSKDLSCNDCPNPTLTAKDNITYRLRVQNEGGCTAEDAFSIMVNCDKSIIFIPNTFSPNNDGMNDRFYPRGSGINTISFMRVFNRWGELVYSKKGLSANDPTAGWDGMYKGTKAPMGVYTYAIEIVCQNSQLLKYIGNLTLIQ